MATSRGAHATGDAGAGGVRERILEAAMAILRETGGRGFSQVQVARRARVRQSHLTYYFPKRRDLAEAVVERFAEGVVSGFAAAAAGSPVGDPAAALQRLAKAIADEGHMRMFTAIIVEADADADLRALIVRATQRIQSAIAGLLGGDDARERAALVLATLWGIGLHDFVVRPRRRSALRTAFAAALARETP